MVCEAASVARSGPLLSKRERLITLSVLVSIGLSFATLTASRHMVWENSWTVARATLSAQPDNVPLSARFGRLWIEAKEIEKAELVHEKLRVKAPDSPHTAALEGEIALARGDAARAAEALGRAVGLRPGELYFASREIEALLEADRLDDAEKRAEEFLSSFTEEPALLFLKARIEERRGRQENALAYYRRASSLAPHRAEYQLALGKSAEANGLPAEAEEAFRSAIREGPGLLDAYGALGGLLLEGGRSRDAIFLLASVVRWHPERPELGMILAEAWSEQGYPERARKLYLELLERNPDGRQARAIKEAIDELDKAENMGRKRTK